MPQKFHNDKSEQRKQSAAADSPHYKQEGIASAIPPPLNLTAEPVEFKKEEEEKDKALQKKKNNSFADEGAAETPNDDASNGNGINNSGNNNNFLASLQRRANKALTQKKENKPNTSAPKEPILTTLQRKHNAYPKQAKNYTPYQFKYDKADVPQFKKFAPFQLKNKADTKQLKGTSSQGNGLPADVQGKMENSLGQDFSNVNIHKDSQQATDAGALAYAQGNDVHFAPCQFKPETQAGQELIGHELTHVKQQREGRVKPTKMLGKGMPVNDDPALEKEADDLGKKAANGEGVSQQKNEKTTVEDKLTKQRTPTENEQDNTTDQVGIPDGKSINQPGIVINDAEAKLKLRSAPDTGNEKNIVEELNFGDIVQIVVEPSSPPGWYYIVSANGNVGYSSKQYFWMGLPEANPKLYKVKQNETALGIVNRELKGYGIDGRTRVNIVAQMNQSITVPDSTSGWKEAQVNADDIIYLPSKSYADSMKDVVNSGSISQNAAEKLAEFANLGALLGIAGLPSGAKAILDFLLNTLSKLGEYLPNFQGLLGILDKLKIVWEFFDKVVQMKDDFLEKLKKKIEEQILKVEEKAREELAARGVPSSHREGIMNHLSSMLVELKDNWWTAVKTGLMEVIWPLPGVWKDTKDMFNNLLVSGDYLWKLEFSKFTDSLLDIWGNINAALGRLSGWISIATIIGFTVAGAVGGAGVGALPGALAGLEATIAMGQILLASLLGEYIAKIIKGLASLVSVDAAAGDEELAVQNEVYYSDIAGGSIGAAIVGAMMALAAIGAALVKALWRRIKNFYKKPPRTKPNQTPDKTPDPKTDKTPDPKPEKPSFLDKLSPKLRKLWEKFDPALNDAFIIRLRKFRGNDSLDAPQGLRGGEGQIFTSELSPTQALKRWYQNRMDLKPKSVQKLIDADTLIKSNSDLANHLKVVKVLEDGADFILREFDPDSFPLKQFMNDAAAKNAIEQTIKSLSSIKSKSAREILKKLVKDPPSVNLHWSPTSKKILIIDLM